MRTNSIDQLTRFLRQPIVLSVVLGAAILGTGAYYLLHQATPLPPHDSLQTPPQRTSSETSSSTPNTITTHTPPQADEAVVSSISDTNTSATYTPPQADEAVVSSIRWKPLTNAKPMRVIDRKDDTVSVYAVGTFTTGTYNNKILALYRDRTGGDDAGYGYFISDASGTPIAWDTSLLVDCMEMGGCAPTYPAQWHETAEPKIGLTDLLHTTLSSVPAELYTDSPFITQTKKASFLSGNVDFTATNTPGQVVDITVSGSTLVRTLVTQSDYQAPFLPTYAYTLQLPFGVTESASLVPPFFAHDPWKQRPPDISWSTGSTSVVRYDWSTPEYYAGHGIPSCMTGISFAQARAAFIITGHTKDGEPLYEIDPATYPSVNRCLSKERESTSTPDELATAHPLFFWQSPYGEWEAFVRSDILSTAWFGHD